MRPFLLRAFGAALLISVSGVSLAEDLKVLCTPTVRSVLQDVLPRFRQETGHVVEVSYDPVGAIKRRVEGGEAFDLVIVVPSVADELVKAGRLDASASVPFAKAGYGVAVKAGANKPDVSTKEGLRRALLEAKGLSYSPDSNSSAYFVALIDKLGLGEQLKPKLKAVAGPRVVEAIGSGEADMTVITVPNIVGERGVELAGLLPFELQNYSVFVVAAAASGTKQKAARELLDFLRSETVTGAIERRGLERVR
jgi:molybdate transport system substrate-binding protein